MFFFNKITIFNLVFLFSSIVSVSIISFIIFINSSFLFQYLSLLTHFGSIDSLSSLPFLFLSFYFCDCSLVPVCVLNYGMFIIPAIASRIPLLVQPTSNNIKT